MGCCEVLRSLFSFVKGILLLVFLWNHYLYLSNANDIPDLSKHVLYGFIVMMSILILLFMVYNLCCCGTNDKKRDITANVCCGKVFFSLIHDFSLLGFLWKYYSHLENTEDVLDWY